MSLSFEDKIRTYFKVTRADRLNQIYMNKKTDFMQNKWAGLVMVALKSIILLVGDFVLGMNCPFCYSQNLSFYTHEDLKLNSEHSNLLPFRWTDTSSFWQIER